MPAPTYHVSSFLKKYHLWSLVLFLCLLGLRDAASLAVWSWYRLRIEIDEASYSYQTHHLENKRDYEQRASSYK
jgi:hypothetical protein